MLVMGKMNKAIIFDRDGTLIKDWGYISSTSDVRFYNIDFNLMRKLNRHFLFFIVSNQSGISKGLISTSDVESVNSFINSYFISNKIKFSEILYCPHQDSNRCSCKKPLPGFLDLVKEKYNIDFSASYVIGDHPSDIQFAGSRGLNGIYLLTGHGRKHMQELNESCSNYVVKQNFNSAMRFISEQLKVTSTQK